MSQRPPDFASEAMVRVLAQGLRDLGLAAPALPPADAATVPLDLKRALVGHAVAQGGLACLPLLGRGLHTIGPEPTHLALTAAKDGHDLLLRWQRLERYIHSRHRTHLVEVGLGQALVGHRAEPGLPAPHPAEDLVVCGVLCALLEAAGAHSVSAHAQGHMLYPRPRQEEVATLVASGMTGTWRLRWSQPAGRGAGGTPRPGREAHQAWDEVAPSTWQPWVREVGALVARRLPAVPTLAEAAASLGQPPRSFQRALAAQGVGFRSLASEVRFRLAGWCLVKSDMPLAEVGFINGYADQAHLTRDFGRRVGLTPARYRGLFAAA